MVIRLNKRLNLFVPVAISNFENFKDSFELQIESIVLKDVNANDARERILSKRPDLSKSINSFMPSNEELTAKGEEMKDIEVIGFDSKGSKISKTLSLNRLLSYDKNRTLTKCTWLTVIIGSYQFLLSHTTKIVEPLSLVSTKGEETLPFFIILTGF